MGYLKPAFNAVRNAIQDAAALMAGARKRSMVEDKYRLKCGTRSDIHEHLPTLRRHAQQCQHVTELGVRSVVSTWAFLAGLSRNNNDRQPGTTPRPTLISVDLANPEKHGVNWREVEQAAAEAGVHLQFIEADDLTLDLAPTDLLFIDTWHVYEQLKAELDRHADKARKFIILHDTETFGVRGETAGHQGLLPALAEFLEKNPHWRKKKHFKNCSGLTVLERKS